jgi:hypothetical protein
MIELAMLGLYLYSLKSKDLGMLPVRWHARINNTSHEFPDYFSASETQLG